MIDRCILLVYIRDGTFGTSSKIRGSGFRFQFLGTEGAGSEIENQLNLIDLLSY